MCPHYKFIISLSLSLSLSFKKKKWGPTICLNIFTVRSFSSFLSCEVNMRKMHYVASLTCVGERTALIVSFVLKVLNNASFGCYNDWYNSAKPRKKLGLLCRSLPYLAPNIIMLFFQFIFKPFIIYIHMLVGLYCS